MRAGDHIGWGRDFPVTHLLVREDEDGVERLWGRCAGVDGFFADRVPPPREILTLRGCRPEGALREALDDLDGGGRAGRLFRDLLVEVWDEQRPVQWLTLTDAVIIARLPGRTDPALVDVVVGASVEQDPAESREVPKAPRFELHANGPVGTCLSVDGLFDDRDGPPSVPMELLGCEPAEPLLAALRRPCRSQGTWVELWALDRAGRRMYHHPLLLDIARSRPSVLGGTLVDITLADGGQDRPPLLARPVWETWYRGVPAIPNQWARYGNEGRNAWLRLTLGGYVGGEPDRSGGVHHLDGRHVTDVPGLHCAMAEAIVGPGGYYGWGGDALDDCLTGGFGVTPPFTLIWHDAAVAREALADVVSGPAGELGYFEDIVHLLRRRGVTVVLD
ncbi:barstar family protein [Streptomyces sp. MI02-7b]|uniref:barstar family protein n=1 Tax=Streptomyces sp. MI02-7b TaxID=462941 RepID=UPI0029BA0D16|nr:barstar family protein [Streptomyces sp. MI02-7b]MDX3071467.1 barstar family protein [Streptomyces sp. MI02-7b]